MDDLISMLGDPDSRVRCSALHTLGCDRSKEGACRPDEAKVLPRAIALVVGDPDPHVRAHMQSVWPDDGFIATSMSKLSYGPR